RAGREAVIVVLIADFEIPPHGMAGRIAAFQDHVGGQGARTAVGVDGHRAVVIHLICAEERMPVALIAAPLAFVIVLLLVPGLRTCGLLSVFGTPAGLRGPDEEQGARDSGARGSDRDHYAPRTLASLEGPFFKCCSGRPITESCRLNCQFLKVLVASGFRQERSET